MSQSSKMRAALERRVIPRVLHNGFYGKYPNFYRRLENRLEILYIGEFRRGVMKGNAVAVECSVVYLNEAAENDNIIHPFYEIENKPVDLNTITTGECRHFYVLKGKYGPFFYTDVYKHYLGGIWYEGVGEKRKAAYKKGFFVRKVQTADDGIYDRVCDEINEKIHKVYRWLEENKTVKKR